MIRTCRHCGESKDIGEFPKMRTCADGIAHQCKKCRLAYVRAWRRRTGYNRQWSQDKQVLYRAETALWRAAQYTTVKALERGAQLVEDVVPLIVLERDDGLCGICGDDVDPFDFHMDHRIPCSQGGDHSYENVQPAHPACNAQKSKAEREAVMARG